MKTEVPRLLLNMLLVFCGALAATGHPAADTIVSCPVAAAYTFEAGRASQYDSYLSPLTYRGLDIRMSGEWRKVLTRRHPRTIMLTDAALEGAAGTPGGRAAHTLLGLTASVGWSALHTFSPLAGLTLAAGGGPSLTGGVMYLPSNSNNPADAVARAEALVRLQAGWRTRVGRLPLRVVWQMAFPLCGVMFAPQYGETYWEIHLGNRRGLVHFRSWGNDFSLDNLLGVDLGLGRNSLRLGWRLRLEASYAGRNDRRTLVNSFVIGLTTDCLRQGPRPPVRVLGAAL